MGEVVALEGPGGRPAGRTGVVTGEELRAAAGALLRGALLAVGRGPLDLHGHQPDTLTVAQLADVWRPSHRSTQVGVAFEVAVARAFALGRGAECQRMVEALESLGFGPVQQPAAFVFGGEKAVHADVIGHARAQLTDGSEAWRRGSGRRMRLGAYLDDLVASQRHGRPVARLPASYRALWRADVFLGCATRDVWAGVSCKTLRRDVAPVGPGIELAVVPGSPSGRGDRRPTTELRGMPAVSLPVDEVVWFALVRVHETLKAYFAVDGHRHKLSPTLAPDLRAVVDELDARRHEPVVAAADDYLAAAGAATSQLWTPRPDVGLAA